MKTNIKRVMTLGALVVTLISKAVAQDIEMGIPNIPPPPASIPMIKKIIINKEINKDVNLQDLKSKEVSVEVKANKGADVYIDNTSRSLEIKTWDQPKVKVVTTIFYEGDASKLSDEEWFEKLNLNLKTLGNSVRIKSGTVSSGGSYEVMGNTYNWSSGGATGVAIFNSNGEVTRTKENTKRIVTIYIPRENKIEIESKYSDVTIDDNINKVAVDITNGNLDIQDVKTLTLRSKYANVNAGNLETAEVEFINGRFSAKDVDELDIDTKYSTIELGSANKMNLISTNDDYDIEQIGSLQGRKSYGNLRIAKLTKSIEMDGINADIKIRNIAQTVNAIKFDNKYADMRLPLKQIKNYTINYVGPYSTVYGNFEKKPFKGKEIKSSSVKESLDEKFKVLTQDFNGDDSTNNDKFTATVGDGKGTLVDIKCQNCIVDFK